MLYEFRLQYFFLKVYHQYFTTNLVIISDALLLPLLGGNLIPSVKSICRESNKADISDKVLEELKEAQKEISELKAMEDGRIDKIK